MKIFRIAFAPVIAIAGLCLLTACGNKGPLVLPQKPVPVQDAAPADPLPAPAEPAEPVDPTPPQPTGSAATPH